MSTKPILNKKEERKLRAIGAQMNAAVERLDALMAEARGIIGCEEPDGETFYDFYGEARYEGVDMAEDLIAYANTLRREWLREQAVEEIEKLMAARGVSRNDLQP